METVLTLLVVLTAAGWAGHRLYLKVAAKPSAGACGPSCSGCPSSEGPGKACPTERQLVTLRQMAQERKS